MVIGTDSVSVSATSTLGRSFWWPSPALPFPGLFGSVGSVGQHGFAGAADMVLQVSPKPPNERGLQSAGHAVSAPAPRKAHPASNQLHGVSGPLACLPVTFIGIQNELCIDEQNIHIYSFQNTEKE